MKKKTCPLGQEELFNDLDLGSRVDVLDALLHDRRLAAPERAAERRKLTVDVRGGDRIVVDEHEPPHARTRERLRSKRADAADAEDGNASRLEPRKPRLTDEHRRAAKAFLHQDSPFLQAFPTSSDETGRTSAA